MIGIQRTTLWSATLTSVVFCICANALAQECRVVKGEFVCDPPPPIPAGEHCPSGKLLQPRIGNCGMNHIAPDQAEECRGTIEAQKEAIVTSLASALAASDRKTLADAINLSIKRLNEMQDKAERVAGYSEAMIDTPYSRSAKTSLECFNTSFDRLQTVVDKMDAAILEVKAKLEEAEADFKKRYK